MKLRSIVYRSLLVLAISLSGIYWANAEDDMPMGKGESQPMTEHKRHNMKMPMNQGDSSQTKMGGMEHDMMMPMGADSSQPTDGKMPMNNKSSQSGSMGCGKDGMNMPMGGMGSSKPGAMEMDEHASHHGGGGMSRDTSASSSMQLPNSSLQNEVQIEELARKRIDAASNMITEGVLSLSRAKESNNREKMHEALKKTRYGIDQFESGLAAQEALDQGVAPRNIAIQWFKKELNLSTDTTHGDIFGISWFHFFAMVALVIFAAIMIWMYFFKMRRAADVLSQVSGREQSAGGSNKEQTDK